MKYLFLIAGIRIGVELPYELKMTQESEEFLSCNNQSAEDILFHFHPVDKMELPEMPHSAEMEFCFYEDQNGLSVYRCLRPEADPYVFLRWVRTNPGYIHCEYVKEHESKLSLSRNILNIIGLETVLNRIDSLLLHCSFIRYQKGAILFTAPSGTGKSTQAELWSTYEGADILNGDRAAINLHKEKWTAWGLPYAGTSGIYRNESAPIRAIVVLRQAYENNIQRLGLSQAVRYIYPELTLHRWDADFTNKALNLLIRLIGDVPVYLLECLPDQGAVMLLKETLWKEC